MGRSSCDGNCSGSYGPSSTPFRAQGFVGLGDHEYRERRIVRDGRGDGHTFSVQLADPVWQHEATIIVKSLGAGEERKHVAFIAHANEDDVEARELAGRELEEGAEILLVVLRGFFDRDFRNGCDGFDRA